jgi:Fe-S-cluster containining protein
MGYLVTQNGDTYQVGEAWPAIDCFRCGVCCVYNRPRVQDNEITQIASKLGIAREAFLNQFVRAAAISDELVLGDGGRQCPFLVWDKNGGQAECRIYPFRPQACRSWRASLSRIECQEGLRKLKAEREIILPQDIYPSQKQIKDLYSALRDGRKQY